LTNFFFNFNKSANHHWRIEKIDNQLTISEKFDLAFWIFRIRGDEEPFPKQQKHQYSV